MSPVGSQIFTRTIDRPGTCSRTAWSHGGQSGCVTGQEGIAQGRLCHGVCQKVRDLGRIVDRFSLGQSPGGRHPPECHGRQHDQRSGDDLRKHTPRLHGRLARAHGRARGDLEPLRANDLFSTHECAHECPEPSSLLPVPLASVPPVSPPCPALSSVAALLSLTVLSPGSTRVVSLPLSSVAALLSPVERWRPLSSPGSMCGVRRPLSSRTEACCGTRTGTLWANEVLPTSPKVAGTAAKSAAPVAMMMRFMSVPFEGCAVVRTTFLFRWSAAPSDLGTSTRPVTG